MVENKIAMNRSEKQQRISELKSKLAVEWNYEDDCALSRILFRRMDERDGVNRKPQPQSTVGGKRFFETELADGTIVSGEENKHSFFAEQAFCEQSLKRFGKVSEIKPQTQKQPLWLRDTADGYVEKCSKKLVDV